MVVDSTFATPLVQRPLELGADLVMHSATKNTWAATPTSCSAPAMAASDELAQRLRERRELAGATPGALEAYLAVRGMRTLALRLQRASASAAELAERLAEHGDVEMVRYPGRPDHPTHATARGFIASFGAVVSFDVRGGAERADAVCRALADHPPRDEPGRRRVRADRAPRGRTRTDPPSARTAAPERRVRASRRSLWRDLVQALEP